MTSICICGAGTMGAGIAQVAAQAGFNTILFDLNPEVLMKAGKAIEKNLQFLTDKKKITEEERTGMLKRISRTENIADCKADLVVEAIVEKLEVKQKLFDQLAAINGADTILATNTSSLSVTAIAKKVPHPSRVAGLHFFNPAPLMKLVEVVKGNDSSPEVIDQLVRTVKRMGKIPVVCRDAPGFIVNRVARPYYIEALRLVEAGLADFETVDTVMENVGFRMGPFRLMDLIGNDVNYAVSCSVYDQLGKPERLKPSVIQQKKVEDGALGRKTGKGYYAY